MTRTSWSMVIAFVTMTTAAAGCALSDEGTSVNQDELNGSFVLGLSTEWSPQNQVVVNSSDGTPTRVCVGACQFAYLAGASLSLNVPFPVDTVNCLIFGGWTGACAGQGTTCNIVLNSNLSTSVIWLPLQGCGPQ